MTFGCCRGGHTFVCLDCKTTAKGLDRKTRTRQPTVKTNHPRCPRCRKPMLDLGLRATLPPRSKWRDVVEFVRAADALQYPRPPAIFREAKRR